MPRRKPTFDSLKSEYAALWASADTRSRWESASTKTAQKILAGKERYEAVSEQTGVPWYMIGCIHMMESGGRWNKHLHNGDSLTKRTWRVPRGRPRRGRPPFTWVESAIDAITIKRLQDINEWPIERILYECERYNGWGYRMYHANTLSPYLWSGTQHYSRGKYVADGKWSSSAVSGQTGVVTQLKTLMELDDSIVIGDVEPVKEELEKVEPAPQVDVVPETFPKAEPKPVQDALKGSKTILGVLVAFLGTLITWLQSSFEWLMQTLLTASTYVTDWSAVKQMFVTAGGNAEAIGFGMVIGGIGLALARRISAALDGKIG